MPQVAGPGKGQPCCNGMMAIRFDDIPEFQDIPWGTIAWKAIYHPDRAVMEGFNGTVKDRGGLDKESCRVLDIAAHTLAAAAALVVYNIQLAKEHGQTDLYHTPEETPPSSGADPTGDTDPAGDSDPTQFQSYP